MSEDDTTTTAPADDGEKKTTRRRTGKIRPGETVVCTVRVAFVDGRVGEESVVEATDQLLDLEAKGYVTLERVKD